MLSSRCNDRECRVLLPEGVRIGERATYPLRESGWSCSVDILPRCLTSGILLLQHSTRMSHIQNSAPLPFHSDVSHSAHSIRIFHIRRLMPDGRGGLFNFPGQTYPDPLIALIRRVSQPFCTVPRCSPEASRYVRPTF